MTGGGRGGRTVHKADTGKVYRPVQAGDGVKPTTSTETSTGAGSRQPYRKVEVMGSSDGVIKSEVVKAESNVPKFRSSLRDSLRSDPPPAPAKIEAKSDRRVVVEHGRGGGNTDANRESRKSEPGTEKQRQTNAGASKNKGRGAATTKGKPENNADNSVTSAQSIRRVISLSSPEKPLSDDKPFVGSLAKSIKDSAQQLPNRQSGREGGLRQPGRGQNDKSARRSSSRDSRDGRYRHSSRSRSPGEARRVDREHESRSVSASKPVLTRKNSTDSISSQRSDRSERNARWDRRRPGSRSSSRRNSPSNEPKRRGFGDTTDHGKKGDGINRDRSGSGGPRPLRRLSSASSSSGSQAPFQSPSLVTTRSSQDVRFQKGDQREFSSPANRFGNAQNSRQMTESSRRSSLDGGAPGIRRTASLGIRSSSQDVRFGGGQSHANPLRSTNDQEKKVNETVDKNPTSSLKSSLAASLHDDADSRNTTGPEGDGPGEPDRKQVGMTLRERLASRQMPRGNSLAEMMKRPSVGDMRAKQDVHPATSSKPTSAGTGSSANEKEVRTAKYFAEIDREDALREKARRAAPFQSSLRASMGTTPSGLIETIGKKFEYSIMELKRLMELALPRPSDLPDMTITQIIQERDPATRPVGGRFSGRPRPGGGLGRSVGSSVRSRDRGSGRVSDRRAQRGGQPSTSRRDGREKRQGRGRGGYQPPPPPLFDGPVEPLTISENRWVPKKNQDTAAVTTVDSVLNRVKSLLNKLTREKFKKLTAELCSIEITSFELLRSIVATIMDKAFEEANFADVYADLCKEFDVRTSKKPWSFVHTMVDSALQESFYWVAPRDERFQSFVGPFDSVKSCLDDAVLETTSSSSSCDHASLATRSFHFHQQMVVAVGEMEADSLYYAKTSVSDLSEDEPMDGPFPTAEQAVQSGARSTTFKRLLVTLCQREFNKASDHSEANAADDKSDAVNDRRRAILAMRAKQRMLGSMRFIGELFKVDMITKHVLQECFFQLLGLELIPGKDVQDFQAQTVRFPDEEDVEALCKMLATAGKKYEQASTKTIMKIILLRLVELSEDKKLSSRSRFLIKDVLEMRDHMWEPRRKELQQKTLDEVRREAQKLQQQGKNAQHDDLKKRRHKTQVTSAQLAKQSSNLIVARKEDEPEPTDSGAMDESQVAAEDSQVDRAQMANRIKSIIAEFISILDLEEAAACVRELAVDPFHVEFAEEAINVALEGKENKREQAVNLLAGLYQCGALSANSIQCALTNVMEFLEDMRIDIPLVHQYSALIFGRLIASGCFGLSWMISDALGHLIDCNLTSKVFAEALSVLEAESNEATVIRMLADEEVNPAKVLPRGMQSEADVQQYLQENGIEDFFGGGRESLGDADDDELDPEIASKMRSTIEEYLSVKDFDEVVRCIDEFDTLQDQWMHFVHTMAMFSLDAKREARLELGALLLRLAESGHISDEDAKTAFEYVLEDYEDLRIDIPQIAVDLCELWTPMFEKNHLSFDWLREAVDHLVSSGFAVDIVYTLLSEFETQFSRDALVTWWQKQSPSAGVWHDVAGAGGAGNKDSDRLTSDGTSTPLPERLDKWRQILQ